MEDIVTVYPNENYSFSVKGPLHDEARSVEARFGKLKQDYEKEGMRRSVDVVLLVNVHKHPHVLVLQPGPSFNRLPGGDLKAGETSQEGIDRILTRTFLKSEEEEHSWPIAGLVSQVWRPHFEAFQYPYQPPHVTKPKESRQTYIVQLPAQLNFEVPSNLQLQAVPLFELHDNRDKYGAPLSMLPTLLSRFTFVLPEAA